MMEEKCDPFEAKGIRGHRKGKTYAAAAKEKKKEEASQGQRESENTNRRVIGNGTEPKQDPN